jgi:predicted metal-dependent hydrolase
MKKESLLVLDQTIRYSVRISERAKRMRVAVYVDGDVVVTKPIGTTTEKLKKFVETKKHWILKKIEQNITALPGLNANSSKHFEEHQEKALNLVSMKVAYWSEKLGYKYTNIAVKQLKSRWGSCSSEGNLNFNYKIIFLPTNIQDYVIVHELCHLKQPNHSKKFWSLVGQSLPDYEKMRSTIKTIH